MAAEEAERNRQRAEARAARPAPGRRGKFNPEPEAPIGSRRLTDRERELVSLLKVESNVAIYQPEEIIPDWSLLKDVMRALGGTWKTGGKKAKGGFRFADDVDAAEIVRLAVANGEILDAKAAELFETSDALADELVAYVAPKPGDCVLEPSAGRGAIARAIRRACAETTVLCVEPFLTSYEALARDFEARCGDFMQLSTDDLWPFDVVCMNPPFSRQQDIRHILHAAKFLKPGGRLAAIASAGVKYRDDKLSRDFRAWVESHGGTIADNPEGSFAHAGTGVRTVRVFVTIGGSK
jgi:predicted RNA methylase